MCFSNNTWRLFPNCMCIGACILKCYCDFSLSAFPQTNFYQLLSAKLFPINSLIEMLDILACTCTLQKLVIDYQLSIFQLLIFQLSILECWKSGTRDPRTSEVGPLGGTPIGVPYVRELCALCKCPMRALCVPYWRALYAPYARPIGVYYACPIGVA